MFVQASLDIVAFQRTRRDSQHRSDGNGSMLKKNLGDRPYKRCRHEFQQLSAEKRLRDVGPDDQTAKRLASRYLRKEAEGLPNSFCRLGVG